MTKLKKSLIALLLLATVGAAAQFGAGRILNYAYWLVDQVGSTPSNPASGKLKVYSKSADGKMYKLDSSGVESEIGSGAGGKNFFTRTGATADYVSTGNNATFDGGGTLDGTFSISTSSTDLIDDVNQINVYKYVHGSSSTNDYLASYPIDIPLGFSGRVIGYEFYYKYDGADDDMEWEVKCTDDSTILSNQIDATLDACNPSNNVACKYTGYVFVPSSCTQLEMGPSVAVGNSGSIFLWDELKIADDLVQTSNIVPENIYSAVITSAGVVTTESSEFIDNVNKSATGTYVITFKTGFFPVIPSVTATSLDGNGNRNSTVFALSTSATTIRTEVSSDGTDIDGAFNLIVQRQGTDYRQFADNVISATDNVQPASAVVVDGTAMTSGLSYYLGFGSTLYDVDGLFSNIGAINTTVAASGTTWTSPKDGYYEINCYTSSIDANFDVDEAALLTIEVNGSEAGQARSGPDASATNPTVSVGIIRTFFVPKGQTVRMKYRHFAGAAIVLTTVSDRSWFEVKRVDKSPITNIPHAIKFQTNLLTTDHTTTGNISALAFTGLTVGKCYRIGGQVYLYYDSVNTGHLVNINNGATQVGRVGADPSTSTTPASYVWGLNILFKAVETTLDFNSANGSATKYVVGSSTKNATYITLEELPICYETSEW